MKILLVSDREDPYIWDHFDRERFAGIDLVISSGDLKNDYLSFLVTMISVPLFYVPGNHDTEYLTNPPEGCESIDGRLVTYKGKRILGLGGSFCYSNQEFQYDDRQMEKRIRKLRYPLWKNHGFDILVTHAPAFGVGDGDDLCHRGFKAFNNLMDKYRPKYFIHGHQHLNYKRQPRIQVYSSTTVINAYGYYILDIPD